MSTVAEWAELGLHPACSLGRSVLRLLAYTCSLGRCVVRLLAHGPVSPSAPCSALKNAHEYSYPVAPLRRSTAGFGPVRGVHMGACAFVACAGSVMTALRCMIHWGAVFVCGTASKALLAIFFLKIFSFRRRWGAMLATRVSK